MDRAVKKRTGFLYIFLMDGQGDVALLHHAVGRVRHLIQQHGIVFLTPAVQIISLGRDEDLLLKIAPVQALIVDGDLRGGAGVQCVQQLGIAEKHRRLILFRGDGVVDIAESQRLGILAAKLKDPIRPDAADGDDVLYRSRNYKSFFVLLQCILQSFNQA